MERRPDGIIHLRSPHALPPYPAKLSERLEYWAATAPERTFLAQRDPTGGWRRVTYAQALDQVRRVGASLLTRDLSPARPIMILSGNDIEHALIALAAMYVGIPYAPICAAYRLRSRKAFPARCATSGPPSASYVFTATDNQTFVARSKRSCRRMWR